MCLCEEFRTVVGFCAGNKTLTFPEALDHTESSHLLKNTALSSSKRQHLIRKTVAKEQRHIYSCLNIWVMGNNQKSKNNRIKRNTNGKEM